MTPRKLKILRNKLRAATYSGIREKDRNVKTLFKRFDKHRKGKLTKDDFAQALKKLVPISNQEMVYVWQIVDKNMNGSIDLKEFEAFLNDGRKKKIAEGGDDDDDMNEERKVEKKKKKKKKKSVIEPVTETEMSLWRVFVCYSMQGEITRPAVMTICQMMRLLRDAGLLPSLSTDDTGGVKKRMFGTPISTKSKSKSKKKKKKPLPHFMTPIEKAVKDDGTFFVFVFVVEVR